MGSRITALYKKLGAWTTLANNTVYQASTDGFVCAYGVGDVTVQGLTEGSNPPTIIRQQAHSDPPALTMLVKKNDYWKVTGCNAIFWIPLEP